MQEIIILVGILKGCTGSLQAVRQYVNCTLTYIVSVKCVGRYEGMLEVPQTAATIIPTQNEDILIL